MTNIYRKRRVVLIILSFIVTSFTIIINTPSQPEVDKSVKTKTITNNSKLAINILNKLSIKKRAPKTSYSRDSLVKVGQ